MTSVYYLVLSQQHDTKVIHYFTSTGIRELNDVLGEVFHKESRLL